MPEHVTVDTATLGALADRLTRTADELAAVAIRGLDALPGSALGGLAAPGRVTADVRRLGSDIQSWVCSLQRSSAELAVADGISAERFRQR